MKLSDLWTRLHSTDVVTWIGHAVQGVLIFYFLLWATGGNDVAAGLAVFVAFLHREISDILSFLYKTRDAPGLRKSHLPDKLRDGFFDLFAPLVAVGIVRGIVGLL